MSNNKILEKVKKLLAMSKDVSSPKEAMIASKLARKLMDKHQIETLDLEKSIPSDFGEEIYLSGMKTRVKTLSILGVCVAKYNDCIATYSGSNIIFKGFKEDTAITKEMMHYLIDTMYSLSKRLKLKRAEGNSFRLGFVHGIAEQVKELLKEREEVTTSTGTNLVICKNKLVVKEFGSPKYKRGSTTVNNLSSYNTGKSIGKNFKIVKSTRKLTG